MRKFIILILALTLLFVIGCAAEPDPTAPLGAIDAGLQNLEGVGTEPTPEPTTQYQESIQTDVDTEQPTYTDGPRVVTEEEVDRFAEAMNIFDLPFDIPRYHSADGIPTTISDPNRGGIIASEYPEYDAFLIDLIVGHWRLLEIPYTIARTADGDSFTWHEYIFTRDPAELLDNRPELAQFSNNHWFVMSRIDWDTGIEQQGIYTGSTLFEPEHNRIIWEMFILLDDHVNLVHPNNTFTQVIPWRFYGSDNLNIATGTFFELMYPSSAETRDDRSTWVHHQLRFERVE